MKKLIIYFSIIMLTAMGYGQTQPQLQTSEQLSLTGSGVSEVSVKTAATTDLSLTKQMAEAERFMKGQGRPFDFAKATALYKQCADAGVAKAMNVLGMIYREGLGTKADTVEAARWFNKACDAGYAPACNNLAIMYHYAVGIPQDYAKAYESYTKAANLGNAEGQYSEGYMLYKGLGCTQNYDSAASLFKKSGERHSGSMYFLGLCYRNGYGITRDTAQARTWLTLAASLGVKQAVTELATSQPEYVGQSVAMLKSARYADTRLPANYKKVAHFLPKAKAAGEYEGYIVKYDWSGNHVIAQTSLTLKLVQKGNTLSGRWIESDTLTTNIEAQLTDTALVFTRSQYSRTDHYHRTIPRLWNFTRAKLSMVTADSGVYLAGNVQFYSPETKEPDKPMYVSLVRVSGKAATTRYSEQSLAHSKTCSFGTSCTCGTSCACTPGSTCCSKQKSTVSDGSSTNEPIASTSKDSQPLFTAYPNPFTNEITVSFTVQNTGEVRLTILNLEGRAFKQVNFGKLDPGQYQQAISPGMASGIYILKLNTGNSENSIIVVKQ